MTIYVRFMKDIGSAYRLLAASPCVILTLTQKTEYDVT